MFSLVLPTYNEEKRIQNTLDELVKFTTENPLLIDEIIFVDGNSTDRTLEIINTYKKKLANLRTIKYVPKQKGNSKGIQIREGVLSANSEWIIFLDSDLDYDLDNILNTKALIEQYKSIDMILGNRAIQKTHSGFRKLTSIVAKHCIRLLVGTKIRDTQCGYKALRQRHSKLIFQDLFTVGWAYDVEIIKRAELNNLKIIQQKMNGRKIDTAQSNIQLKNILRISYSFFRELLVIRSRLR